MSEAFFDALQRTALLCTVFALAMTVASPILADDTRPKYLEFDFPEVHIGIAEYDEGPTGTTVFYFPDGVIAAADVRGGSPGTVNAPAVLLGYETPFIDAVVFSGGSWYGLSAATGAANAIKELKQAEGEHDFIAGVLGGIIYDVGIRRFTRITPDDALGAAALRSAEPNRFPLGARGAGRFAMQGGFYAQGEGADSYAGSAYSGQGAAFRQVGPTKIAVFTVVNAVGAVVDRQGRVVRCHRHDPSARCPEVSELIAGTLAERAGESGRADGPTRNTTLTLVVTNQKLPFAQLQRLAIQVHTSMGRAIQPFATVHDGDVLYAVTTDEIENPDLTPVDLATIASEVAWDAVLSSVPELPSRPPQTDEVLDPASLQRYVGTYGFPGNGRLAVTLDGRSLSARFTGNENIYFDEDRTYRLVPAAGGLFMIDARARDLLRFDERAGDVVGLTINPGPWKVSAQRIQ